MSLSAKIFIGLGLGILGGLFVGEPLGALAILGDAYIRLLQMTVLPYIMVSLIAGLGRLDPVHARLIGLWGGGLLMVLWVLSFATVAVMPFAFPSLVTASFYSTTMIESVQPPDFVGLYIPDNPFHALANTIVPAVVVFSVAVGVALIGVPQRHTLIRGLDVMSEALLRVNDGVVRLAPVGVFVIAASTAGTMTFEQFQRVQVYLISYVLFALFLTFWLLPAVLACLTPVRQRHVLGLMRDTMITAFATGSAFVVLPQIVRVSKELFKEHVSDSEEADAVIDIVVSATLTFPHAAKVLSLSFILFAGWMMNSPLSVADYPILFGAGVASLFGSVNVAIPFLLDLFALPHDTFQLFVATSVLNSRFGTLVQTMHMLVLTLLTTTAIQGRLDFRWPVVLRYCAATIVIVLGMIGGSRALYALVVDTSYRKNEIIGRMEIQGPTAPAVVHLERSPAPELDPDRNRLEQILERGVLRVGYREERTLPFSYFNDAKQLVGLDVELAHSLALGLGVTLEFVPVAQSITKGLRAEILESGYCDIMMSRSVISMDGIDRLVYSNPYLDLNLGFVVLDERRGEFVSREILENREGLRIAIPGKGYYLNQLQRFLPKAEFVPLERARQFIESEPGEFDALAYPAEEGAAVTLLWPDYSVVVPSPPIQTLRAAYPLPKDEPAWERAVNLWLKLQRADGTIDRLYDYWILGQEPQGNNPRWSVMRDVLGWVD
jgi:Na+/H+-dicarboxylate symporter/ABC-type amino acid transport substrate-binding protein